MKTHLLIEKLQLKNYKAHASLRVEVTERFSVIAGRNGAGKTSLLKALLDAGVAYTPSAGTSPWQGFMDQPDIARVTQTNDAASLRIVRNYPVEISAVGVLGHERSWRISKLDEVTSSKMDWKNSPYTSLVPQGRMDSEQAKSTTLPLIVFSPQTAPGFMLVPMPSRRCRKKSPDKTHFRHSRMHPPRLNR